MNLLAISCCAGPTRWHSGSSVVHFPPLLSRDTGRRPRLLVPYSRPLWAKLVGYVPRQKQTGHTAWWLLRSLTGPSPSVWFLLSCFLGLRVEMNIFWRFQVYHANTSKEVWLQFGGLPVSFNQSEQLNAHIESYNHASFSDWSIFQKARACLSLFFLFI